MKEFTEQDRKADSEAKMLTRMKDSGFTHHALYARWGDDSPEYRQADRLIQRERKAGNIKQIKRGQWIWCGELK